MLRRKLWRDIRLRLSQFVTIFLMVFLGIFIYTGITSYMDGMSSSADRYYESNNLPDLWVTGVNLTDNDLTQINNLDNIKDAEGKLITTGTLESGKDETLQINFIGSNDISKFHVVDGVGFDAGKTGVWLDSYLAENNGYQVGDNLKLTYQNVTLEADILGLVLTPDHIYDIKDDSTIFPTHTDYGFAYLSNQMLPAELTTYNSIMVDVDDTANLQDTKIAVSDQLGGGVVVITRQDDMSYNAHQNEIEEGDTYSRVFTSIFLLIAVLSVITTMSRFVRKERGQIGILKALGFKKARIVWHYVSYGFWIALAGAVFGLILGPLLLGNFFIAMEYEYFEIPFYAVKIDFWAIILSILTVVTICLATYLSCRSILRESPADALKPLPPIKINRHRSENSAAWQKTKFHTKWNLRDISRNKFRTITAVTGVTGCCMLILCAFGLSNTMTNYLNWQFDDLYNFNYKLSLESSYQSKQLADIINRYNAGTSQTVGIEITNQGSQSTNNITVDDSDGLLRYSDATGKNNIELKEGVYVTSKLAETLDLGVGDTITWRILGTDRDYSAEIVGLNRHPQNQGLTMTRTYYESLGLVYKADTAYTDADLVQTRSVDGVSAIQGVNDLKDGMASMLETMRMMISLLIAAAAVLGAVIIYNLGVLSLTEKEYQFATLKVLGFRTKQIQRIFIEQNIWLAIISVVLGLPLGYIMTSYIFKSALSADYDMMIYVDNVSYVYAIAGTLLVVFVVSIILSRKIKTIDMVSSLKSGE